ncbi:MAG TPA: hypothetical protein VGW32_00290, partial [Pyrinomonadaceae bacterium]|nr:hypothetical protein [Pyrinomonadaceae bacterium]
MKRLLVAASVLFSCAGLAFAQNSNSSTVDPTTRERTVAPPRPTPTPRTVTKTPTTDPKPSATPRSGAAGQVSPSGSVLSAFNSLLDGIRHADVKAA